jgi:hypothetical protein
MNDIEKRARELLSAEYRKEDQYEYAHHITVGGDIDYEDQAALRAIIAALELREGELLAGRAVNLLDQHHSGVVAAQVLEVVPAATLRADEAGAVGIGGQGDQSVGIELAEVAPEHEVGVPAGSDSGMTASLTPPGGYVMVPEDVLRPLLRDAITAVEFIAGRAQSKLLSRRISDRAWKLVEAFAARSEVNRG